MQPTIKVRAQNKIAFIGPELKNRLRLIVDKTSRDIEAQAKTLAPVDTGFLKNSIEARMTGDLSAEVNVGAEYGIYVEMGTSKMPAQPYLTPAAESVRQAFRQAVSKTVNQAVLTQKVSNE